MLDLLQGFSFTANLFQHLFFAGIHVSELILHTDMKFQHAKAWYDCSLLMQ